MKIQIVPFPLDTTVNRFEDIEIFFNYTDVTSLYNWVKGFFRVHDGATRKLNLSLMQFNDLLRKDKVVNVWIVGHEFNYIEIHKIP